MTTPVAGDRLEVQRQPAVEIRDVRKKFGRVAAVDGLSLTIGKGEIVSLLGPSGCGKTTTLRIIAGLDGITKGEVFIDGGLVASSDKRVSVPPEKRSVGLVFQNFALWPHMTVRNNIDYCLKSRKLPKSSRTEKIQRYLELVNLVGYENRYPSQLSGGEQQRVALARALAYEPKVLLMDEPLSNIDMKDRARVIAELRTMLKGLGTSVLHVTHDQNESFALADRVVVMEKGRVMQEGNPVEIYERPRNLFVAQFIGRSNVLKGKVRERNSTGAVISLDGSDLELVCSTVEDRISNGDARYVSFRPNMVQLSRSKPEFEENVIAGDVVEAEYRGESYEYKFVSKGLRFLVSVDRSRMPKDAIPLGASYLYVPKDSIYLFEG